MHPRVLEAHFLIHLQQSVRLNKTPEEIRVKQNALPLDTVLCTHQRNGNSPTEGAKQLNVKAGSPCFQYRMKSRKYNPCEKVIAKKNRFIGSVLFQIHFCHKLNVTSLITTHIQEKIILEWSLLTLPPIPHHLPLLLPCV